MKERLKKRKGEVNFSDCGGEEKRGGNGSENSLFHRHKVRGL